MCQRSARASALVMLPVSVLLTPTASYCNRAMMGEVSTRAPEVCDQKMVCGRADKPHVGPTSAPESWGFNSAQDTVVGAIAFGLVDNKSGVNDSTLQSFACGATPGIGARRYAVASDCFPRRFAGG